MKAMCRAGLMLLRRSVFSSHFPQPGRPWPRWPCQSSVGPGRPTSIASAPVKSPTSAPSPPACGDRRPASARRAGRCSSGEGSGGYAAVTTARMVWPASQLRRPARLAQVTIAASNQIGVAQMTAQIPVVMQSIGRSCLNVATLARHPGWAPENDTALKVELERPAEMAFAAFTSERLMIGPQLGESSGSVRPTIPELAAMIVSARSRMARGAGR
jgi:hypothetical protein